MISKKIIINKNNIDIVTTNYNKEFLNNINKQGRVKHNYALLSNKRFKKCLKNKIKTLKKYNNTLDFIRDNNEFNIFLTIRNINKQSLKRFVDRLRKTDKQLQYVTLASWSIKIGLHYHIILNTSLSSEQIIQKLKNENVKLENIYNKTKLVKYFKKNLNYDTIHILKQTNAELKQMQIEILSYSKILTYSKGIKYKPVTIKNPADEQIKEIYNNSEYIETIEYNNLNSKIQIDKFVRGA